MFTKSVTLPEAAGAGFTACTRRPGALYIRAGHRGKRTDEGKSQGLSLVDSDWFHFQTIERRAKKYVRTKAYFYFARSRLTSRDRKNTK
jgi:hypothetical protein